MQILGREGQWIHTRFLMDCTSLAAIRIREIGKEMTLRLRQLGIEYGLHFTQLHDERTCRIVLECIPFMKTLDLIEQQLQGVVRDIPARLAMTKTVREERSGTVLTASR